MPELDRQIDDRLALNLKKENEKMAKIHGKECE